MSQNGGRTGLEPVRLGIVGLGEFGRVHALTGAAVTEARLAALVDSNGKRLEAVSAELPSVPCWTDLDRALAESDAEAWIVAASTAAHVPLTKTLLAAGKPVLLEKPIAQNVAAAQTLAGLVSADSGNLMLGHVALFNSEFRQLLEEVRRRGPIAYIDCVRHRPATTQDRYPGESPFKLTMVHDLYLVLALMNGAEPVQMAAQAHRTADGRCDLALAQLQWSDGMIASLSASFLTPAGMASDGFDRLEVFGHGWAARLLPNPRPIEVWDDRARWPLALEIRTDRQMASGMLAEQLRTFCRVVRGLERVPRAATFGAALQVLKWTERLETAGLDAPELTHGSP
jgi:predicted dehydrogenase